MKEEDFSNCTDIGGGIFVCTKEQKEEMKQVEKSGLLEDISKAVLITTVPVINKEEASFIETTFASIIIGSIISGVSIAFGFYIYYIMGYIQLPFFLGDPFLEAVVMLSILIIIIAFLSFLQYRTTKALSETNILERFASDKDVTGLES